MRQDKRYIPKKPIPDVITAEQILKLSKQLKKKPTYRALIYFCYLSGCRISEALMHKPANVTEVELHDEKILLFKDLYTLKNRQWNYRSVPAIIDSMVIREMADYLLTYKSLLPNQQGLLFPGITRQMANGMLTQGKSAIRFRVNMTQLVRGKTPKILENEEMTLNPHYLRHCRCTHWADQYNYSNQKLMYLGGWSSENMPNRYNRKNWKKIAENMVTSNLIKKRKRDKK